MLRSRSSSPAHATPPALLPTALVAVALAVVVSLPALLPGPAAGASSAQAASPSTSVAARAARPAYRRAVAADRPVAHLRGLRDLRSNRRIGRAPRGVRSARLPNGRWAPRFSGWGQYLTFPSRPAYSIATTGRLTVEYWIRPDTLQFPREEGSGYVYLLGKGDPGRHEWYARMYSKRNAEDRPNRLSGYAFNPSGGLGVGSYVQDRVRPGRWIQLTLVYNTRPERGAPAGTVRLYKNGWLRDRDSLADLGIHPRAGGSALRIGTGYLGSFFEGAVGDVTFYDKALPGKRIRAHYRAMYR